MQAKASDIVNRSVLFIIVLLLLALPFFVDNTFASPAQSAKYFLFAYGVLLILLVLFVQKLLGPGVLSASPTANAINNKPFELSWMDLTLLASFLYITIRVVLSYESFGLSKEYFEFCGLAVVYCVLRPYNTKHFDVLFGAMMVAAMGQAIYGHLQIHHILPSHHHLFKITGGFLNPGHYAGYMAAIFPIALSTQLFTSHREGHPKKVLSESLLISLVSLICIICILSIIPSTRSRAAWLALIASTGYLLYVKYNLNSWIRLQLSTTSKKLFVAVVLASLLFAFATGLYFMKKGSADGRILIWRVSVDMIKDKPVFGHGYERFEANYLNYQAKYFESQGETSDAINADDTTRAFNEFIEVTSELGIVGFLLISAILYQAFCANPKPVSQAGAQLVITCRAGLIAIVVFSCFSYPLEILPIKLSLMVCIAGVSSQQNQAFVILSKGMTLHSCHTFQFLCKGLIILGVLAIVWTLIPLTKALQSDQIWKRAFIQYQTGRYQESIKTYQQVYGQLMYNGDYLTNYGKACSMAGSHRLAIRILKRAETFFPNSTLYTAIGDSYKAIGNYQQAERSYLKAANMVPHRFYAKYLLAKLYDESGQSSKAMHIASELLQKKPKVKSLAVDEIKKQMQEIVNKSKIGSS